MKNIITTTILILTVCLCGISQESNFITYQAVASDRDGQIIKDQSISIMFEIFEAGNVVYAEEHTAETSSLGVFSVLIGNGAVLDGSFGNVNWDDMNQKMSLYIDPDGGTNYFFLGQSSFSSVPYAKYGKDADADPENEIQHLYAKPVGPNTIDLFLTQSNDSVRITTASNNDKLQSQSLANIQGPNIHKEFWLASDATNKIQFDAHPGNEFQTLSSKIVPDGFTGDDNTILTLTNNVGGQFHNVMIVDTDIDNEIERLQFKIRTDVVTQSKVTELKLVDSKGMTLDSFIIFDTDHTNELQDLIFSLREGANGTYGDLALSKNPGVPSITLPDLDPTNELQDLYYDDGVLYISGGNEVELPIGESSSSPWEYLNNQNIYWPDRVTVGDIVSEGPGWFNNLTSMNNVFSQIFRTPNGMLVMDQDHIKLGSDFTVDSDGYMYVKEIAAEIKNFRMDHPEDPTKEIYYVSLEGPEAGAYERGTAKLVNGEAFIEYSDHFRLVKGDNTPTMILTPHSIDTYGLAVVEKRANGFVVKELKGGNGNFEFDWEVKTVRAGYEDYQVVRDKK